MLIAIRSRYCCVFCMSCELGSLGEIARRIDGLVIGDPNVRIASIAAVEDAESATLTFATDERYLRAALESRAAAILAATSAVDSRTTYAKPIVVVTFPRLALASLLAVFETPRLKGPFVDPSATIDPSVTVGADVYIARDVSVGAGTVIGARSVLAPGCVIGANTTIGEDCYIDTRAYVGERSVLGDRVTLKPQAVIAGQGFGWAFLDGGLCRIPQIGYVQLGDDVEIGSNTCVDRAQTGVTAIGEGTKIDNLVQIGHNCRIGKHCAIAAQSGLAGSTIVGDYVQMGGQVGIAGHLTIGSRVRIAARSEVWGEIADGMVVSGAPARAHRQTLKIQAYFRRIPELYERLRALEKHVVSPSNPQQNSSAV
jgi:UDP-3-O-[3-hydroxymyristoyl] glucosamine N-acyltransferase